MDVTVINWLLAVLPILALIVLMVGLNWTAHQAGTTVIFITAGIAFFIFGSTTRTLAVSSAMGVWDAVPILYVIWPALLLYHVMDQSGGYDALRYGISRLSKNELFIIIGIGWVFVSFLQGVDGFGTPIAIVAPLLLAFGMRPIYAVAIPIIAHIWAKFYGTLGVGWLATLAIVNLDEPTTLAMGLQAAGLMIIQAVGGGFMVAYLYGRWAAVRDGWPLILIIGAIQGIGQVAVVYIDPALAAFLPAAIAMLALYPLSRWRRYREPSSRITERPAMRDEPHEDAEDTGAKPPMGVVMAFAPYVIITVLALATLLIEPVRAWLDGPAVSFTFPALTETSEPSTGILEAYSPLHPLTHPGLSIVIAALVAWFVYKRMGYFAEWARRSGKQPYGILRGLFGSAVPASVPIVAFLVFASIMKYSGQNEMLALGIAAVAPAYVFAFLANGIGLLGAFMTSSSTSSQVIFSQLQVDLARAKGLSVATVLAAQAAGSAIGNAIAPANIVMGASTTGLSGKEGAILRKTIPWTMAMFVLTGLATVAIVLFS
jgi:lactate permease